MTAEYKVHGDIAVITLDNPPVNGLGLSTRQAIADSVNQANADAKVKAIVVTGAGRRFRVAPTSRNSAAPRRCKNPICSA